jgi:hypothetical protein
MSHRARLTSFEQTTRCLGTPELEANGAVPIFWLALFGASGRDAWTGPGAGGRQPAHDEAP